MAGSPTDQIEEEELLEAGEGASPAGDEGADDNGQDGAGSPPAEDGNKPKSILDAVTAALAPKEEQSSSSGEGEGGAKADPSKAAKPGEEDLGELTEEELNSYKPKTRKRIEQFRNQAKALSAELEQYKAYGDPATVKTEVEGFRSFLKIATDANLTKEEVNSGFNFVNLAKNNVPEFVKQFGPLWNNALALIGEVLPPDLQTQVQRGEITPVHAKELARLRAGTAYQQNQQRQTDTQRQEAQKREATQKAQTLSTNIGTAVLEWEQRQKASDPDYSLKASRVLDKVKIALSENGTPTSVEQAMQIADNVKKEVDAEFKKLRPAKKVAITPVQGNGATHRSKPVAKSTIEAMQQALGH